MTTAKQYFRCVRCGEQPLTDDDQCACERAEPLKGEWEWALIDQTKAADPRAEDDGMHTRWCER